ncbi:hypothetical protein LTR53_009530 [Teratosphaeriaceae sp. CCFEE 6253]|nr:hypothetical protein LTR53_009530 [Teratosphaeriaceae sp. CCFEE 6253]
MAKDDGRTVTVYHSCDPNGTPILHHFKSGRYTLFHPQLDPHATAPLVRIPKRNGLTAQVRRCQRIGCEKCAQTDVVSDLTIEVAMAHGIRRAPLKPSAKAKTVYERLQDGQLRGQWIYGDPRPNELVKKVLYAPKYTTTRTLRARYCVGWLGCMPRRRRHPHVPRSTIWKGSRGAKSAVRQQCSPGIRVRSAL